MRFIVLTFFLASCASQPYAEVGVGAHLNKNDIYGSVPFFFEAGLINEPRERISTAIAIRHDSHLDAGDVGWDHGPDSTHDSLWVKVRYE
ncbi:MAG: hypothetical protein GOVbin7744_44 [Prokaryotic dsDNA virus sp.]|nr:MAG: hypothetical protein GOVbin7744_44 [Prokaryotic dsDNA virus sp.]|tara:strand:+ start:28008 stop:28277 length:270 start_codon:yes stop_codon:yes gene_type:complete